MKKFGVIGYGWLASRVVPTFFKNYVIYTTTTSNDKLKFLSEQIFNPKIVTFPKDKLLDYSNQWNLSDNDVLFVTIPFITRRNSKEEAQTQAQNISSFIGNFGGQIIVISTTSVYKQKEGIVREEDIPSTQVAGEDVIREHYPQANILRCGGLMGDNRKLSNYNIQNTQDAVNHVHYKDVAQLVDFIILKDIRGEVFNVVAPHHPTKQEVIDVQKGKVVQAYPEPTGKIVSSEKLINKFKFEFNLPDPSKF